jgi:hypothetical protein
MDFISVTKAGRDKLRKMIADGQPITAQIVLDLIDTIETRPSAKTKVFLVSSGSYSDWSIEGIFSTRELAERFKAQVGYANDVSELVMDEWLLQDGDAVFAVRTHPGDVVDIASVEPATPVGIGGTEVVRFHNGVRHCLVAARNTEHAIKIAADKFRQHIAMRTK